MARRGRAGALGSLLGAQARFVCRLPGDRVAAIEKLRRVRMTAAEIAEILGPAISTVSRWLKRIGLGRLGALEPPEPPNRYERKRAGELVHLDVKKLGRISKPGAGHRITGNRQRLAELSRRQIAAERLQTSQFVRETLGERPAEARKLEAWNQGVHEIHAYRQRHGVRDPQRVLGAQPKDPVARADYAGAQQAIRGVQRRLELGHELGMERGLGIERGISIER